MNKLDLEETTRRFHNVYEQVAKEYGYKTREDTKELDFNSPNGMTMLKTVETITTPYLEEIERLNNELKSDENYYVRNLKTIIKEKEQEIERLQRKNEILQTRLRTRAREDRKRKAKLRKLRLETTNQRLKLERLHSIIKEVREYIEKELSFNVVINGKENKVIGYNKAFDKILEILDKDNE